MQGKKCNGWTQWQNGGYRRQVSEFEDRTIEVIQARKQRENKVREEMKRTSGTCVTLM